MPIWVGVVERLQDVGFATGEFVDSCVRQVKGKIRHAARSAACYLSGVGCYKTKRRRSELDFTVSITLHL